MPFSHLPLYGGKKKKMYRQKLNGKELKRRMLCALLLAIQLPNAMRAWAMPLSEDELALLLGSKNVYSRQEVAELVSNILNDAEEEIERTAQEAAREVAAQDAGEIAFQKSLAESIRIEAARIEGERKVWRTCAVIETIVIIAGVFVYGITR